MGAFQRDQRRMVATGLCLNAPMDLVPEGKWPFLSNVRSYQAGILQARLGLTALANGALGAGLIHTIGRINDPTPFAANAFWRIFGAGAAIRAGQASFPQIDTGYSGNPLTIVVAPPVQSASPWAYVGDSTRQRKFDVNGHVYPIGIAPPLTSPTGVVGPLPGNFLDGVVSTAHWVPAGASAGALSAIFRVNTTMAGIIFDSGTTGNASVVPNLMTGINTDAVVTLGGVESLVVLQVCLPIVSTTIAAILYDAGATGACTIQPTGSLGLGQLDAPDFGDYAVRAGGYGADALLNAFAEGTVGNVQGTPPVPVAATGGLPGRIRQIDFPVNCLVNINGVETVRILSVSVGPDGIQSFRAVTTGTYAAGQALVGVASFRVCTQFNYAAGATIQAGAIENVITPSGSPPGATGGIMTTAPFVVVNNPARMWNSVATQPQDDVRLSVRISNCTVVTAIRLYMDIDAVTADFTQNYFFFEWRANDIIAAIQGANIQPTATLQQVRLTTVSNEQVNAINAQLAQLAGSRTPTRVGVGQVAAGGAVSQALAIGNNQWLDLHCKVADLIHVGTDPSRSLQNVTQMEVLVQMAGANAITVDYGAMYLSGGNNPDCGTTGAPRVYAYRYRSSLTGARSNPSPVMRGGLIPRRQYVSLAGTSSPDPQADLIDWFTMEGPTGILDRMTYIGTGLNGTPVFTDNYSDSQIVGGPTLDYDIFQPWVTTDKVRTGTANIAGSAVARTGGDTFGTNWAPGTIIIINGQSYTIRAQPPTASFLEINENAGAVAGVTWVVPEPNLLGTPMRSMWGPDIDNIYYGCGDPNNPGFLYWTFPNDPDRHPDANSVQVTSGSERLQSGFMYDDRPYVFSSDQLYAIVPGPAGGMSRQTVLTPCGRGAWTPWFYAIGPEGTYFGTKDGIFLTTGGSPARSVTDADLHPLFPHDGVVGVAVNGVQPPDFTNTNRLRLSIVNGWLYFDYVDIQANPRTLVMRTADHSWWFDTYTPGVSARMSEPGNAVYEELIGGANGTVYVPGGITDAGTAFQAQGQFVANQGDARIQKVYRDLGIEADLGGGTLSVTLGTNNNTTVLGSTNLTGASPRTPYQVSIIPTTGAYGTNLTVLLQWNAVSAVGIPALYFTDIAYQNEVEYATSWLSGPTTFGLSGYLQAMGAYIAYLSTVTVNLSVIIDNVVYNYGLPSTGGVYAKIFVCFQAVKGLTYQIGLQSATTAPLLAFDKDMEFFVQPWGQPGGYKQIRPF